MKYLLLVVAVLSLAVGCKRKGEPVPKICTSKENYKYTDTIRLENCSDRYTKQRWLMPDGSQSTASVVYFVPTAPITYQFRLYVTDENFVQEYEAIKEITVAP
jgi:hypothetical protein